MDRAQAARDIIAEQLKELGELIADAQRSGTENGFERLNRWKTRTVDLLRQHVHPAEADRLDSKRKMSFLIGDPFGNLVEETRMYAGFLTALDEELRNHPESVLKAALPVTDESRTITAPGPPAGALLFIVHGRDELNLLRLKTLLRERWNLESLVLSAQAGRGRTLIEKFEEEAQRSTFAFVLITPDDLIQTSDGGYAQARPNVLFELGWFYGRLGRERVCILFQKGAKLHSDLDGISRVEFTSSIEEKLEEIERELITAGVLKK
jgi:predicted nucleotide-binding protein